MCLMEVKILKVILKERSFMILVKVYHVANDAWLTMQSASVVADQTVRDRPRP